MHTNTHTDIRTETILRNHGQACGRHALGLKSIGMLLKYLLFSIIHIIYYIVDEQLGPSGLQISEKASVKGMYA